MSGARAELSTRAAGRDGAPRRGAWRAGPALLAALAVAVPFALVMARLLAEPATGVRLNADFALTEVATREAAQGTRLLGPWSRFGWHHPGPSYFYLLAPVYVALGSGARGLYVGALMLNAAAALGVVAVVARRAGGPGTLWAAAAVLAFAAAVGPAHLRDVWNPYVVALPTLLFVVCCAAAVGGGAPAVGGAAVVGSFLVQTHVGTAPFVAVLLVAAWAARRLPDERGHGGGWPAGRGSRVAGVAAGLALVVLWLPPLVEQATGSSGNLSRIAGFVLAGPSGQPFDAAAAGAVAALTAVPFGPPPREVARTGVDAGRLLVLGAWLAAATTAVLVGRRRGDRFAAALGGLSLGGGALCALLVTRVTGALLGYLLFWMGVVPLAGWLGLGLVTVAAPERGAVPSAVGAAAQRALRAAPALALAGLVAAATLPVRTLAPVAALSDERVDTVVALIARRVDLTARPTVLIDSASHGHGVWILAMGVIDELDRRGADVSVGRWQRRYGDRYRPTGDEDLEVLLGRAGSVDPALTAAAERAGRAGDMEVFFRIADG